MKKIIILAWICLLSTTSLLAQRVSEDLAHLDLRGPVKNVTIMFDSKNMEVPVQEYFPLLRLDPNNYDVVSRSISFMKNGRIIASLKSEDFSNRPHHVWLPATIEQSYAPTSGRLQFIRYDEGGIHVEHTLIHNDQDQLLMNYSIKKDGSTYYAYLCKIEESSLGCIQKITEHIMEPKHQQKVFVISFITDRYSNWIRADVYAHHSDFDETNYLTDEHLLGKKPIGSIIRDITYY